MILNFKCEETQKIFLGHPSKKFSAAVNKVGKRKLDILHAAHQKKDLRIPRNNCYEELKGELKGYSSIRINDQYRVVFIFKDRTASNVYICDYHK